VWGLLDLLSAVFFLPVRVPAPQTNVGFLSSSPQDCRQTSNSRGQKCHQRACELFPTRLNPIRWLRAPSYLPTACHSLGHPGPGPRAPSPNACRAAERQSPAPVALAMGVQDFHIDDPAQPTIGAAIGSGTAGAWLVASGLVGSRFWMWLDGVQPASWRAIAWSQRSHSARLHRPDEQRQMALLASSLHNNVEQTMLHLHHRSSLGYGLGGRFST
jgi:hypothetical protein